MFQNASKAIIIHPTIRWSWKTVLVNSRKRIAAVSCSLLLIASFDPQTAYACKDRAYPESFPVEELDQYEHVYVIHVDAVTFRQPREATRYAPPFNFEGKVVMSLKGPGMPGERIQGITTSNEEAHARCPIRLEAGKTYLLMLNGGEMPYALPRYGSLYISSTEPEFERYASELTQWASKAR